MNDLYSALLAAIIASAGYRKFSTPSCVHLEQPPALSALAALSRTHLLLGKKDVA
ncbi:MULTISPECIES: hypothetical protein [Novosphingobium]|uniref:Uncharacterized protein n=1 Tax=Novosphingobium decolorationis TaxID=2698673 RepID=A0ABX8E5A5_9SPHN|nr:MULTISPECIES: hypothetical protein [Novosphingobium]QVM84159.1 hypothetical protein HT578_11090 [Novosphingobium decolorationis]